MKEIQLTKQCQFYRIAGISLINIYTEHKRLPIATAPLNNNNNKTKARFPDIRQDSSNKNSLGLSQE